MSLQTLPPGDHTLQFVSSFDRTKQPFRLYLPSALNGGQPLPLVIVLHGKYVDHNAWFDYTPIKDAAEKHGYIVAAPYGRGNWFYRGAAEQDVLDIVELVKSQYFVDADRVYLMGHSMGGWGTWWLGVRHPDIFATICPMAAMAPRDMIGNAAPLDPLIIHSGDDPVVPVWGGRDAAGWLTQLGISHRYREEWGYGHSSAMIGDNFDRIFAWFAEHRRTPRPRRLTYSTRLVPVGAWWIRLLETRQFPRLASVTAEWINDQELMITAENIERLAVLADRLPENVRWPATLRVNGITRTLDKFQEAAEVGPLSAGDQMKVQYKPFSALEPQAPQVLGVLAPDFPTTESGLPHVAPVAAILKRVAKADYALLHRDQFRLSPGPLTAASLLDLYIYPEDMVGTFVLTGADLLKLEDSRSAIFDIEPLEPRPVSDQTYLVVAPFHYARNLNVSFTPLPHRIGEYIVEYVKQTQMWP